MFDFADFENQSFIHVDEFEETEEKESVGFITKETSPVSTDAIPVGVAKKSKTEGKSKKPKMEKTPKVTVDFVEADFDVSEWMPFGLSEVLLKGLQNMEFKTPTEIQQRVLPIACNSSKHVIGVAETVSLYTFFNRDQEKRLPLGFQCCMHFCANPKNKSQFLQS